MLIQRRFIIALSLLLGIAAFLPAVLDAESYIGSDMSLSDGLWVYKPETGGGRDGHGFVGIGITDAKTLPSTPNGTVTTPNLAIVGNMRLHGSLTIRDYVTVDTATPASIDWRRSNNQELQLGGTAGAWTINFGAPPPGPTTLTLLIRYTATSGTYGDFTWTATSSSVKWPQGIKPVLSTPNAVGRNKIDIINFFYDGISYYGVKGFGTL